MSRTNKSIILVLTIFVAFLSACSGEGNAGQPTPTPVPQVSNYERSIFVVERGPIVEERTLIGEIVPSRQEELFFRASGYVSRMAFKQGDTIKQGDILAELQVDDLLNQLEQARIDLEVAQANLDKEKAQFAYDVEKAKVDVFTLQKQVELAQTAVNQSYGLEKQRAQANLEIAQQNLKLAEMRLQILESQSTTYAEQAVKRSQLAVERLEKLLAERQIIAPFDGIVLRSIIRPGQSVDAFFTSFIVGDPTDLVVRVQYDSELVTRLSQDTEVKLFLNEKDTEGYPAEYLPGFLPISAKVEGASSARSSGDFMYFAVSKDVPREQIRVGRSVTLKIILGKKDDALLLPPAAIREYKGLKFVIVQEGEKRRRVEISKVGLKSLDRVEVIADLQPGDQVVGP